MPQLSQMPTTSVISASQLGQDLLIVHQTFSCSWTASRSSPSSTGATDRGYGACAIPRFGRGSASYPRSVAVGGVRSARVATNARHQPFALRVELLVAG